MYVKKENINVYVFMYFPCIFLCLRRNFKIIVCFVLCMLIFVCMLPFLNHVCDVIHVIDVYVLLCAHNPCMKHVVLYVNHNKQHFISHLISLKKAF